MFDLILPDSPYLLKMIQIGGFILGSSFLFYALLAGMKAGTNLEHQLSEEVAERGELEQGLKVSNQEREELAEILQVEQQRRVALEQETAALREQQKPRRLSQEQKQKLIHDLSHAGAYKVSMDVMVGDFEAIQYGRDFAEVFDAAGWTIGNTTQVVGTFREGLSVAINDAEISNSPPCAAALVQALSASGLSVGLVGRGHAGRCVLKIGPKPNKATN